MQQMAEVRKLLFIGEVRRVRQSRERRNTVHRGIENQLRPLRGLGILESLGFQSSGNHERRGFLDHRERRACGLERPHPCWSVEVVLDVSVAVTSTTHESGATNDVASSVARNDLFAS